MSQTLSIQEVTWWCLSILESILESAPEIYPLGKKIIKSWSPKIFVKPCTLIHNLPCRAPCRLFIHELFFGPLDLHLLVWSELGPSPSFRPMRALTWPWSRAFSLVCEVALSGVVYKVHGIVEVEIFLRWVKIWASLPWKGPGTTMSTLTGLFMVISAFKGCLCLGNKHKLKVENQNWLSWIEWHPYNCWTF
jgi:hypothetical protein